MEITAGHATLFSMPRSPEQPPVAPKPAEDRYDIPPSPDALRERLFNQDRELLAAANKLANAIRALPHDPKCPDTEPRALLVGGFVRDSLIGKHPKDADLEIYGVSSERLEELLEQLFPGRVNAVGKTFGVYKIALGEGLEFDISIPRLESKTGPRHDDITVEGVPSMSVEDAARRRDFTFNSLAADPLTGEVIDPFNGLEDLRNKTLRVTDAERFQDDPLRVYRALQFAARMDLKAEPQTHELLKEMVDRGELDHLPKERVSEELKKLLLKSEKPSVGFELARELGIIEREFPELHALIGVEQEKEWHPEGDVWIHTMMVTDAAAKIIRQDERGFDETQKMQVMVGALCHDLGKPSTTKLIDGRMRALGHEEAGEEPTKEMLSRLQFGSDVELAAVAIAKDHLKPGMHAIALDKGKMDRKGYTNAIRKLIRKIHPVSWQVLVAASEADSRGRTIPGCQTDPYKPGLLFEEVVNERELDKEPTKPLLQGRDLLEMGMKPGKEMGLFIKAIELARDNGEIQTREEALMLAKERLS